MLITLTSDFGVQDPFVGIMKGVIASIHPQARVIDLSHGIPPQNILAGALTLRHSVAFFPRGTIHVAVVDPGVGSARRALLIESEGNFFIGPDNGVLSLAVAPSAAARIVELNNPAFHRQPSGTTFHGRDIFAPVAAHLSRGVQADEFGEKRESYTQLSLPKAVRTANSLAGEVIYIDRFGNLFTNIEERDLTGLAMGRLAINLGAVRLQGVRTSYASARPGELVAVLNSWGVLEIAVSSGSAAQHVDAKVGDRVKISFEN